jgi:hypothetical protein
MVRVRKIIFLINSAIFITSLHAGSKFSRLLETKEAKKLRCQKEVAALTEQIFPVKEILPIICAYARSPQLNAQFVKKTNPKKGERVCALTLHSNGSLLTQIASKDIVIQTYSWMDSTIQTIDTSTFNAKTLSEFNFLYHGTQDKHLPSLICSPQGKIFALSNLLLLEISNNNKTVRELTLDPVSLYTRLLLLEDGTIILASSSGAIQQWAFKDDAPPSQALERIKTYAGHSNQVIGLVELPNGNFASMSRDCAIIVWTPGNAKAQKQSPGDRSSRASCLAVFPNGDLLSDYKGAIGTPYRKVFGGVIIWNSQGTAIERKKSFEASPQESVDAVAVLDDHHFVTRETNGSIFLWHIDEQKPIQTIQTMQEQNFARDCPPLTATCFAFDAQRRSLFSGARDGTMSHWIVDNRSSLEIVLEDTKPQATPFTAGTMAPTKALAPRIPWGIQR